MGTFDVKGSIGHMVRREKFVEVPQMLVDTGSEHTWVPGKLLDKIGVNREKKDLTFQMANGQLVTRNIGFAIVRLGEHFTIDEEGDLLLLGARSLEGMNRSVDSRCKKLVATRPFPAA
ncbi:MAG: aspartyl protease family protein [Planctomycetia bacterium]|nr:aspartyl protease family protein [Planctomycetia bacterium]